MKQKKIKQLIDDAVLSYTDIHLAYLMESLSGENDVLFWIAAMTSSQSRGGHICLDIEYLTELFARHQLTPDPDRELFEKTLINSSVIGTPGEFKPFVYEEGKRLYLYRYWEYQKKLADLLLLKANQTVDLSPFEKERLKDGLQRFFPQGAKNDADWQKKAACISILKKFSVISGGPGTGKTTTITKVLALLAEQRLAGTDTGDMRIALAAPTGKAAARLRESISETKKELTVTKTVLDMIPDDASTIHRLLGTIRNSPYFRYNEKRKLPVDVLVVDESSMVDIALMSKLVQALPESSSLILLGDQDQLASVEAGAVLGDICNTGNDISCSVEIAKVVRDLSDDSLISCPEEGNPPTMSDCITVLKKSYRFDDSSGIKKLSVAVNEGDDTLFYNQVEHEQFPDIRVSDFKSDAELFGVLQRIVSDYYSVIFTAKTIQEKLTALNRFRILCAVRKGGYGVERINALTENILQQEGHIKTRETWYPGRPVMITQNDYQTGLFNGDTGITVASGSQGFERSVCFMDSNGGIRKFRPGSIPFCETVYAMTVHKSQGSEFDRILFLMPDKDGPLVTREMIYTGITRSRSFVDFRGAESIIRSGIKRKTERISGLRDALWVKGYGKN